jgi:predicted PurR-regulated permease PerM
VYLLLIGAVVALGVTLGSRAAEDAANLSQRAPELIERMKQQPVPLPVPGEVQSLRESVIGGIQSYIYQHYTEVVSFLPAISLKVLKASGNLIYVIVVPIMSFFILKDGRQIRDEILDLVEPGPARKFFDDLSNDIHTLLLQYVRALFALCSITLVTFAIVLSLMGVPYSVLLASIAFPLEFIPLVGPLVAAITIISVNIFSGYPHLLAVIAFLGIYRMIQDYVISPRLMSAGVELQPLFVILGVFAGGEIAGVKGTFLSVPVMALLRVVYRRIRLARAARKIPVVTEA